MTDPTIVVGGTWAALVAADGLAARGQAVRLLLPERGVGGGFLGRRVRGRTLELGLRVLELDHEAVDADAPPPPLEEYRAASSTGHLPYLPLVKGWVEELAGDRLIELGPGRTVVDGRLREDVFLTADPLGVGDALGPADRRAAAAELGPHLAAGVLGGPLDGISLGAASLINHGQVVHERVIAPFADKVVAGGADRILARYRRRVWTPLFWPQSIWEACVGRPLSFRPRRPQRTVAGGGLGELALALLDRLHASDLVTLETAGALQSISPSGGGAVSLGFSRAGLVQARRPVVGVPATELYAAAGVDYVPERARTVAAWVEAPIDDLLELPDATHVVDRDVDALRVTTGGGGSPDGWRLMCVELRHDLHEEAIDGAVRASLERSRILQPGGRLRRIDHVAAATFPVPTPETATAFAQAHETFSSRALDAEVIGGATDLAGDYLNEQIVAGLACAAGRHQTVKSPAVLPTTRT